MQRLFLTSGDATALTIISKSRYTVNRREIMNFIAIDFETANAARSSPCAIGLTVVERGIVATSQHWLIRPHDMWFDPFNIAIHGITPEMVRNQPEFDQLWPELQPYISQYPIVAHNAAFDMSVLRKTLDSYGLKYPKNSYLCSVLLAKITWPGLASYRLDYLAGHLGFELKHHDAASDANGAASIVMSSASLHAAVSFPELVDSTKIRIGSITDGWYEPCRLPEGCRYSRRSSPKQEKVGLSQSSPTVDAAVAENPLYGKCVVFTGKLETLERAAVAQQVVNLGGLASDSINADTDYLVVGSFNATTMRSGGKSAKLRKAESLAAKGQPIEIVGEEDFLRLL